jgi:DNA-binding HxlR family transcriptional regulator
MRTYGQFCPIARAAEVLAERWTLLVVRELLCGSQRFGDILKGVPLMPRSVLAARLVALADAGIVQHREQPGTSTQAYVLTDAGQALEPIVFAIGNWGTRWAKGAIADEHLDVTLLMWDVHRRIDHNKVPRGRRTVARFEFPDAPAGKRHIWLSLENGEADVCYTNPGYVTDIVVTTGVRVMTEIWMGRRNLAQAIRVGDMQLEGPVALKKLFPTWLLLSSFVSPATATRSPR